MKPAPPTVRRGGVAEVSYNMGWFGVSSRALTPIGVVALVVAACARSTADRPQAAPPARETDPPAGTVVTADDFQRNRSQTIEQVLRSKCPPCIVTLTANGRVAIHIRGRSTILGSSEPLYVIDGVPIEPGPGGALVGINPYDIETIEVLTDPTSISMYGSRGANGVIVISTKGAPPPRR
ncbi:MAG: TonB-dependent receptor plug domain-containing protein [Gemmatimonadota bacterium]|nr:TonB-dependent receptor plug domain-containing protein [Gemmatimonadota bacterium]